MENNDRPLLKAGLWRCMSTADKSRIRSLSVQFAANKKVPRNQAGRRSKGVSLEMLAQSGLLGADPDDPQCSQFVTSLVECQADVVQFVQTLPGLQNRVSQFRAQLIAAAEAGHLTGFGEANTMNLVELFDGLVSGLDVYAKCPFLATEHAVQNTPRGPDQA